MRVSGDATDNYVYLRDLACLCDACAAREWPITKSNCKLYAEVGPWRKKKLTEIAVSAGDGDGDDVEEMFDPEEPAVTLIDTPLGPEHADIVFVLNSLNSCSI